MTYQPKYIDTLASGPTIQATDVFAGMRGRVGYKWTAAQIATYIGAGNGSVGTVTSGVWHGTAIQPQYGGTGLSTALLAGEMLRGSGGDPLYVIPAGARHQILTVSDVDSDMPAWSYDYIPTYSKTTSYTFVAADQGSMYVHSTGSTPTWTIPSNASVPFKVGTTITFRNKNGAGDVTIAITSDTLRLVGTGATGSRTLAANGLATAVKEDNTEWVISGTGLT